MQISHYVLPQGSSFSMNCAPKRDGINHRQDRKRKPSTHQSTLTFTVQREESWMETTPHIKSYSNLASCICCTIYLIQRSLTDLYAMHKYTGLEASSTCLFRREKMWIMLHNNPGDVNTLHTLVCAPWSSFCQMLLWPTSTEFKCSRPSPS